MVVTTSATWTCRSLRRSRRCSAKPTSSVSSVSDEQVVAERMVLDRGGLLINVSAIPASAVQRLRQEPGPASGTVLMNAGIAPGLTSLLAADLLAEHPEADEVELVFTVSVKSSAGPSGAASRTAA